MTEAQITPELLQALIESSVPHSCADVVSRPAYNGVNWITARIIAVDSALPFERYAVAGQMDENRPETLTIGPDALTDVEITSAFWEYGLVGEPNERLAAQLSMRALADNRPPFPVAGCFAILARHRFWVGFDPPWPISSRPGICVPV